MRLTGDQRISKPEAAGQSRLERGRLRLGQPATDIHRRLDRAQRTAPIAPVAQPDREVACPIAAAASSPIVAGAWKPFVAHTEVAASTLNARPRVGSATLAIVPLRIDIIVPTATAEKANSRFPLDVD